MTTTEDQAWVPDACALPTVERPLRLAEFDEVAGLLAAGGHRHGSPDARLQERARQKLAEVEAKISDLRVIAETLRAAVAAGCDDLIACAGRPRCPIPFATIGEPGDGAR
jgi:MerR-like DNA binding protein